MTAYLHLIRSPDDPERREQAPSLGGDGTKGYRSQPTADVLFGLPLVERGDVEHTYEAPVLFRLRKR